MPRILLNTSLPILIYRRWNRIPLKSCWKCSPAKLESKARTALLDLLKDIGKNQMAIIGEHLSDSRWIFVRDIIHVLSETKSDGAVALAA